MTDITFSREDILAYIKDRDYSDKGVDCRFFEFCGVGIKVYAHLSCAEFTFKAQSALNEKGFAPKCWGFVDLGDGRGAYLTQLVDVAKNYLNRTGLKGYDRDDMEMRLEGMAYKLARLIERTFGKVDVYDIHCGNFGFLGLKLVFLDVGHFYMPDCGSKWG